MPDFTFSVFRRLDIGGTDGRERAGSVTVRDDNGNRDTIFDDIEQAPSSETNGDQEVISSDFAELGAGDTIRTRGIFRFTNNLTGETYDVREVYSQSVGGPVERLFILTSTAPDWIFDTTPRSFSLVNSDGTLPYSDIVCFADGTLIKLKGGRDQLVQGLRVGDDVMTQSGETHPIRWIGSRCLEACELWSEPKNRPICIRAGALGFGQPSQDLMVSPQHRILVRSLIAERMFGQSEVLIAAKNLVDVEGIDVAHDVQRVTYFHLLFDAHQVIFSNDALTESLFTGPEAMKSITSAQREEIFRLFPDICGIGLSAQPARFIPERGRAIRKMVARHRKNNKPLLMTL